MPVAVPMPDDTGTEIIISTCCFLHSADSAAALARLYSAVLKEQQKSRLLTGTIGTGKADGISDQPLYRIVRCIRPGTVRHRAASKGVPYENS